MSIVRFGIVCSVLCCAISHSAAALPPPSVSSVAVRNTNWSGGFNNYAIPDGAMQLNNLPWLIDQVIIEFSENVSISASDFGLYGVTTPNYAFGFTSGTDTATLTLASPIMGDKLLLQVKDSVLDGSGNPLDGNWVDSSSPFPSGDGSAGGDFLFRFDVLTGDVNGDGVVSALDLALISVDDGIVNATPNITLKDIDGDAIIEGSAGEDDFDIVLTKLGNQLPVGEPEVSAAVVPEAGTYLTLGSFLVLVFAARRKRPRATARASRRT